jgi:hypothetical protein
MGLTQLDGEEKRMDDAYIESILSECGAARFPEAFLADFEATECLAHTEAGMTLLVQSKKNGRVFRREVLCGQGASLPCHGSGYPQKAGASGPAPFCGRI